MKKLPLNQVLLGDSREIMKSFPDQSIDTIVTELDWLNMNGVFSWKVNAKGHYDQNRGTKVKAIMHTIFEAVPESF